MKYKVVIFLFLVAGLMSCEKEESFVDLPSYLEGKWDVDFRKETYRADTLSNVEESYFQLEFDIDGTGLYGFPSTNNFINLTWSVSFDKTLIFITIENTFDPNELKLHNSRLDILEDEEDYQLWGTVSRGGGVGPDYPIVHIYWTLNKI